MCIRDRDAPKVNPREVTESVGQYSKIGKQIYGGMSMIEVAKSLSKIAEDAHNHIVNESDDWFDKVTINRNMKSLNTMVSDFKKTATEYHTLSERLTSLYEDMGGVLNRYYDIDEDLDKVDPSKVEPEDDFKDREDKDIDNDGDTDDSDEYLHKKRQAISKAVKSTKEGLDARPTKKLSDINSVSGIPALGDMIRKK